jgi:hypothetical protein
MAEAAPALGKTDTGTPPWLALAWRYGLSVTGPLAVSGAQSEEVFAQALAQAAA